MLRRDFPHIRVVARALGGDIYPEQNPANYIPFRCLRVSQFDAIAPCAVHGRDFLLQEGFAEDAVTVARLGIPDAPGIAPPSPPGHLAFISCSSFVPVKRLPLLIDSLRALALAAPDTQCTWDHLGGRTNRPALLAIAEDTLGDVANCSYTIHEDMPLTAVRAFFASKPLDALLNVSFSEGLPVSMMEATACGLPVLGTDVGGVRDIVTPQTGILLPMDFTAEQFVEGALRLHEWKDIDSRQTIARFSREYFSASKNYRTFIEQVLKPAMNSSCDAVTRKKA
jgi:glycosyltransferase involved in cell wall biosynthesis